METGFVEQLRQWQTRRNEDVKLRRELHDAVERERKLSMAQVELSNREAKLSCDLRKAAEKESE